MNVRVLDAEGKLLSQSRDVDELRHELGAEAARSVSAMEDPQWTRDGLVAWDFDTLPVEVEIRRGPLAMKAYPMLVDRGDGVSLRLADTPERATYQTYFGLRRLFYFAGRRSLETQAQWMPNYEKMLLLTNRIRGLNLRSQLAELIADRAYMAGQPLPRSSAEFHEQLGAGQQRVAWAVQEVVALVMPMFEGFHQAELALENASNPLWQYAISDVRAQLDTLAGPNFLSETPWDWLKHFPRYFRAVVLRLEALPANRQRDAEFSEELYYRWQAYAKRLHEHEAMGIFDPELAQFRWMLEEYRVSLYAQRLGTAMAVSSKRLDRQWAKVRG
jgi:ATP-dependent helicase HrpA